MGWYINWFNILNDMIYQIIYDIKSYNISNDKIYWMNWYIDWYNILNDIWYDIIYGMN